MGRLVLLCANVLFGLSAQVVLADVVRNCIIKPGGGGVSGSLLINGIDSRVDGPHREPASLICGELVKEGYLGVVCSERYYRSDGRQTSLHYVIPKMGRTAKMQISVIAEGLHNPETQSDSLAWVREVEIECN